MALIIKIILFPNLFSFDVYKNYEFESMKPGNVRMKFLEVPQIVWGLNNQKIAFARACLTARMLNRSLLMPSLSASLFYKEIDKLQPISFDKLKHSRFFKCPVSSLVMKCLFLIVMALIIKIILFPNLFSFDVSKNYEFESMKPGNVRMKFLEVPQIVWGLNNQKIAFARACLTARMLNRSLLMPSLSASLFYKEIDKLQPISFDKVFNFEKFNSLCNGFVHLSRYSDVRNQSDVFELQKGSGRRWTLERDLDQLKEFSNQDYDVYETIKIVGKNPFLWHDHWSVSDYAKVFECLVLVDEISKEANEVVSKIREVGAVANELLEDNTILSGWKEGMHPVDKKRLGVTKIYDKHPYLIQAAIDYEVCLRADVFVGNSYSTFSSLLVLERTQMMIKTGVSRACGINVRWPSYAYNLEGESGGPRLWMTNYSDSSLQAISYGSNAVSC
ncbi:GDP-fucose protein O-fucosyltransferase [Artemisia annua]|uniref:GDP-fucose protein O-fucosyltransferase n=1 Tax=Artemisia annua TaxID=35608 RepID=A0A2U1QLV9_ARTAN|nr:GDP-fucose protein O-fucosyltransferase [Artemisia annua]